MVELLNAFKDRSKMMLISSCRRANASRWCKGSLTLKKQASLSFSALSDHDPALHSFRVLLEEAGNDFKKITESNVWACPSASCNDLSLPRLAKESGEKVNNTVIYFLLAILRHGTKNANDNGTAGIDSDWMRGRHVR